MHGFIWFSRFQCRTKNKRNRDQKSFRCKCVQYRRLLSRNFLLLVGIASLIAFPIAWWAMNNWLKDFPYRITISWWIFGMAIIVALVIAFLTVSFQSIKAAVANPVKSLRTE